MRSSFLEAGRFLLYFFVSFFVVSFLFSLIPYEFFALFFAKLSLFVLSFFGVYGEIYSERPVLLSLSIFKEKIWLSYLCTGLLELFVVWSSILATKTKDFLEKALGLFLAVVFILIFNTFRIVLSILVISWFGLEVAFFSHDFFFRVFLFFSIFVFYALWLFYSKKILGFLKEVLRKGLNTKKEF
ncbi:MAG: exosortase/archaeosortase family protein [Candidatus Diapherotrites archaeon]